MPIQGVGRFNHFAEIPSGVGIRPATLPLQRGCGFLGERKMEVAETRRQRVSLFVTEGFPLAQVGGVTTGGAATLSKGFAYAATGGATAGGAASTAFIYASTGGTISEPFLVSQPFLIQGGLSREPALGLAVVAGVGRAGSSGLRRDLKQQSVLIDEEAQREEPVPYTALLRSLIESEQVVAARRLLEGLPLQVRDHPSVRRISTVLAPPTVKRIPKQDIDRSREYEWLRAEAQKYRGQWVALGESGIVASAWTLRELRERLTALTLPRRPLIHRVE